MEGCKERGVAIGYDHRRTDAVSSRSFALLSAAVFLSRGFKVYLFRDIVCTPLVVSGRKEQWHACFTCLVAVVVPTGV